MAPVASTSLARQLGSLFEGGSAAGLSDRQLLERFAAGRDAGGEAAFAALVARHGPMVLNVCRQVLGDHQHAEDAFQAVFFVLARKARSLREPERLGNWLYGVAVRTSRKARTHLARRRRTEEFGVDPSPDSHPTPPADRVLLDRERAEALHTEIDRLPGTFRTPVVLCYFEGLTLDEAAHRLHWPVGTLRSRLARAREKLRRGLTRRGVVLPGATLAAMLSSRSASASVPSLLCDSTTRAAIAFAARHAAAVGGTAPAAALAQEVLRAMIVSQLKTAATLLLLLSMIAAGASSAVRRPAMGDPPRSGSPPTASGAAAAAIPDGTARGRMTVAGRVLDPQGKPIPSSRVAVLADRKRQAGDIDGRHRGILMGTVAAGADGRFALEFSAIPSDGLEYLGLIAAAPGRALAAIDLKLDAERQETSIALPSEKPVEGRLVDVQGQPAAGVVVRVAKLKFQHEFRPYDAKGMPVLWPSPATTDADGRFRVLALGDDSQATYEVEDPRYAHQEFSFQAEAQGEGSPRPGSTITLRPAKAVNVHVVHSDDGTPAAGALVSVLSLPSSEKVAHARTDGQGQARVVAWPPGEWGPAFPKGQPEQYRVRIDPPEGEPYLHAWRDLDWPKGAVQQSAEFKLWRGVVVRGRVIEDPAGTPVAGARVNYYQTTRDNPRRANLLDTAAVSKPDGTFTVVVPRGPGHLLVRASSPDYVHVATSYAEMGVVTAPWFRFYTDADARLDIKGDEATHPVEIRLRRGVTIRGRVVGPDGKPVAEAFLFGRSYTPFGEYAMHGGNFNGDPPHVPVKDGRFEIPGCDPEKPSTFYFLDLKDRLGATVELSGRSAAAGPVTVQLQPTATARFLLKDKDGKLLANSEPEWPYYLSVVITPGPEFVGDDIKKPVDETVGDYAPQVGLLPIDDRRHHSGPDGRVTMFNLIPGAPYRFRSRYFTPEPGQTIDLGEILVEKPGE